MATPTTPPQEPAVRLALCLICESTALREHLEKQCAPPHVLSYFSLEMALAVANYSGSMAAQSSTVELLGEADGILVVWDILQSPLLSHIMGYLHRISTPVFALCEPTLEDEVAALVAGADDVIPLPLSVPLLKARILAYRRTLKKIVVPAQTASQANSTTATSIGGDGSLGAAMVDDHSTPALKIGPMVIHPDEHRFYIHGIEVHVTTIGFNLLYFLMRHPGILLTRDRILERVWGIGFETGTNVVAVHIYRLRSILKEHGLSGVIQTVRGQGYRFIPPASSSTHL